jgi:hypothetical protein
MPTKAPVPYRGFDPDMSHGGVGFSAADCHADSRDWVAAIVDPQQANEPLVLGFSGGGLPEAPIFEDGVMVSSNGDGGVLIEPLHQPPQTVYVTAETNITDDNLDGDHLLWIGPAALKGGGVGVGVQVTCSEHFLYSPFTQNQNLGG